MTKFLFSSQTFTRFEMGLPLWREGKFWLLPVTPSVLKSGAPTHSLCAGEDPETIYQSRPGLARIYQKVHDFDPMNLRVTILCWSRIRRLECDPTNVQTSDGASISEACVSRFPADGRCSLPWEDAPPPPPTGIGAPYRSSAKRPVVFRSHWNKWRSMLPWTVLI
jgi:hypothetical protein